MAQRTKLRSVSLVVPENLHETIIAHLFPGDDDEHGLVIAAGVDNRNGSLKLLAREVFCAIDGEDYVAGQRGYRMLKAEFIHSRIRYCRKEKLAYIAVHNHGGNDSVAFSQADLDSHERGYPALRDLGEGIPVGAAVYARNAIAGDIWLPNGLRYPLNETRIIGKNIFRVYPNPRKYSDAYSPMHDRQILMFGTKGQQLLREATVGIIGVGGVGSLLVEYLARLGVGRLIVADQDRIDESNLSRVVGATLSDTRTKTGPGWLKSISLFTKSIALNKVDIAERTAKAANPTIEVEKHFSDFSQQKCAQRFLDCDFLFLAADSMRARLVFNAITQQYFIPGIQIGSKITASLRGEIEDAFSVERWVLPRMNCLWCAGMISPHQLALEAKTKERRLDEAYGTAVANPSVITMNAVGASHAANDFLFSFLGLHNDIATTAPLRFKHLSRSVVFEQYPRDLECPECGDLESSRFGRGDAVDLPTIQ